MTARVIYAALTCLLAAVVTACGPSPHKSVKVDGTQAREVAALATTRACFRRRGYRVAPDSAPALRTAPRRFDFIAVWNLVNPNRVALAVTFSRSVDGAARAAAWVRKENVKVGRGIVDAPVVRFGKIDVLWTAKPDAPDVRNIYGCVRQGA